MASGVQGGERSCVPCQSRMRGRGLEDLPEGLGSGCELRCLYRTTQVQSGIQELWIGPQCRFVLALRLGMLSPLVVDLGDVVMGVRIRGIALEQLFVGRQRTVVLPNLLQVDAKADK